MGRATLKEGSIWAPPPTPRPIPQRKAARGVVEWKSRRLGCSAARLLGLATLGLVAARSRGDWPARKAAEQEVQRHAMTVRSQQSLAIFDLDNTLVDRDRFFAEWTGAFIRERHLDAEVSLAILRDADEDGAALRTLFFERVQARLGLKGPIEDLIDEYWRDQVARYRCDQVTIAGLRLLRQLGYKLGIATNGGARQIDKV